MQLCPQVSTGPLTREMGQIPNTRVSDTLLPATSQHKHSHWACRMLRTCCPALGNSWQPKVPRWVLSNCPSSQGTVWGSARLRRRARSHACVLPLNRTLGAGVWECSIPSSYWGIPKQMVKLDFQLLWSSRMGVTHQGGGREPAHVAQCFVPWASHRSIGHQFH